MTELQKLINRIDTAQGRIQLTVQKLEVQKLEVQKLEVQKQETQKSTIESFKSELDTTIADLESYIEDAK